MVRVYKAPSDYPEKPHTEKPPTDRSHAEKPHTLQNSATPEGMPVPAEVSRQERYVPASAGERSTRCVPLQKSEGSSLIVAGALLLVAGVWLLRRDMKRRRNS